MSAPILENLGQISYQEI